MRAVTQRRVTLCVLWVLVASTCSLMMGLDILIPETMCIMVRWWEWCVCAGCLPHHIPLWLVALFILQWVTVTLKWSKQEPNKWPCSILIHGFWMTVWSYTLDTWRHICLQTCAAVSSPIQGQCNGRFHVVLVVMVVMWLVAVFVKLGKEFFASLVFSGLVCM